MTAGPTVYLVDDEPGVRTALSRLLRAEGLAPQPFASADAFLAALRDKGTDSGPACLVLDVSMPGTDGLALQEMLAQARMDLPIVFLTAHGDIPMSVRAVKAGASDFLTKPVNAAVLLPALRAALGRAAALRQAQRERAELSLRLASLTPREHEVLRHVIAGKINKLIAQQLGTVEQTVKVHRRRVMEKLAVDSVPDLVRLAERLGVDPAR